MKTFVCGHRNPDVDSVMSAYALADLRRRTGMSDVEAICAGRLPPRAKWVFEHFHLKGVRPKRDVYVRVRDLVDTSVPMIDAGLSLVDALKALEKSGESSLPVKDAAGKFVGISRPQSSSRSSSKRPISRFRLARRRFTSAARSSPKTTVSTTYAPPPSATRTTTSLS